LSGVSDKLRSRITVYSPSSIFAGYNSIRNFSNDIVWSIDLRERHLATPERS
jgi:hypothetical protein